MSSDKIEAAFLGLAIGDALGVPVEFQSRAFLEANPVVEMVGYGSHNQSLGTWSDDSSLTFCLAESLCKGLDLDDIASKFVRWHNGEIWNAHDSVFDIGISTNAAIKRMELGTRPDLCGGFEEDENGNGSLMRILPLAFYLQNENDISVIFQRVKEVSSLTHAHFRSVFSCFIYIIFIMELLKNTDKNEAYSNTQEKINLFYHDKNFSRKEIQLFDRLLQMNIADVHQNDIKTTGYVLHTLEAALWCILSESSFEASVLKAVNLGDDTDTTACVVGGIAGLFYGKNYIPNHWIKQLIKANEIINLAHQFNNSLNNSNL